MFKIAHAVGFSVTLSLSFALCTSVGPLSAQPVGEAFDDAADKYAKQLLRDGKQIFRFDTFGDEAFWGDALQLHKAIAGEKNGGVGPGVSPRTALSVGLKVAAGALPNSLKNQLKAARLTSTIRQRRSPFSS
ncbi:MAG: hypothetical protein L0Y58_16465 [Verrucomicrobia subdivision 3 bacterium]|nr:hypothetical protein [Limisphaerales bacterium]